MLQAAPAAATTMRLPHSDWLLHRLTVGGPKESLQAFRRAASGAGVIPWHLDLDRMQEDFFHRLAAPMPQHPTPDFPDPAPAGRLSVNGARALAAQLADAVARRHARAVSRVGRSHACPLDLHALVPVPAAVLRLGPDDSRADAWLWQHWGTCQALRHVTEMPPSRGRPDAPNPDELRLEFWAADWSPWRAMATIAEAWPALRFALHPSYDPG